MRVTSSDDKVTHAIISGNEVQEFSMSNRAEFFHVLSDSLYSNKTMAVVRETLCNAWDAHIEAGTTDIPIEVRITDDYLEIEDSGPGIPPEMIQPLYLTYGGTSKEQNENVTGGFGLGCKAPFAMSDHFEVHSCHGGRKRIYKLSKSSPEREGRPGAIEIVNVPTDRTGILVKIPIDYNRISQIKTALYQVAYAGDILVKLNDSELHRLPYDERTLPFVMAPKDMLPHQDKVLVRYGNVVYPMPSEEDLRPYWTFFRDLGKNPDNRHDYHEMSIILLAPPNSLSVTPSRESLSVTDHTMKTLKNLLEEAEKKCINMMLEPTKRAEQRVAEIIAQRWRNFDQYSLVDILLPNRGYMYRSSSQTTIEFFLKGISHSSNKAVINEDQFKLWSIKNDEAYRKRFVKKARDMVLFSFEQNRFSPIFRYIRKNKELIRGQRIDDKKVFYKSTIGRIAGKFINHSDVGNTAKFYLTCPTTYSANSDLKLERIEQYEKKLSQRADRNQLIDMLSGGVVLAFSKMAATEALDGTGGLMPKGIWNSVKYGQICIVVPRNNEKLLIAVRKILHDLRYFVLDLTLPEKEEAVKITLKTPLEKKAPKPKGLLKLSGIIDRSNGRIESDLRFEENAPRMEKPEIVVSMTARNRVHSYEELSNELSARIAWWIGDKAGLCSTGPQMQKYLDQGAKRLDDWMLEHLQERLKDADFRNEFTRSEFYINICRLLDPATFKVAPYRCIDHQSQYWFRATRYPLVRKYLGIPEKLTITDRILLQFCEEKAAKYGEIFDYRQQLAKDLFSQLGHNYAFFELADRIRTSSMLRFVDFSEMGPHRDLNIKERLQVRKLIDLVMKG